MGICEHCEQNVVIKEYDLATYSRQTYNICGKCMGRVREIYRLINYDNNYRRRSTIYVQTVVNWWATVVYSMKL